MKCRRSVPLAWYDTAWRDVLFSLRSPHLLLQLVQRNRDILTETARMLDEEEREDTELKTRFKEKWTRQPSAGLAENLRKEVHFSPSLPSSLGYPSPLSTRWPSTSPSWRRLVVPIRLSERSSRTTKKP